MSKWLPIETAPKDGTIIDVWLGNAEKDDIDFYCTPGTKRSPCWYYINGKFRPYMSTGWIQTTSVIPTHWMPLPELPNGSN